MKFNLYTAIYLITNLFIIVAINKFVHIFFETRKSKIPFLILSYAVYFILISLLYLLIDIPLITLIANFISFFVVTLNYKGTMKKRALSSLYILVFMFIPEILVGVLTGYFRFSFFEIGNYSSIFGLVFMRLVTYLEAIVLYHFKSVKKNESIGNTMWFSLLFIPLTTLFLRIFVLDSMEITQSEALLAIILILAINVIAFLFYDALASSYQKAMSADRFAIESKMYQMQCELMKTTTDNMRQFRHDLKNQFSTMECLLELKAYDELSEQIHSLTRNLNQKTMFSSTGNLAVDSIINYKLQDTLNKNIHLETEIAVPETMDMETADVVSLIGNLLDNSLQALDKVNDEKYLYIKVLYTDNRLILRVKNRYVHQLQYENGVIQTSKFDRENHGFGLKSIRQVVENYQGRLKISHDDEFFTVDALLYL